MRVREVPVGECAGCVLLHAFVGPDGKRVVGKGTRLEALDVAALRGAGAVTLWVGELEPGDVLEDEAASELAALLAGPGLAPTPPRGGRVDLLAEFPGLFEVDEERLLAVNLVPGVGVATVRRGTPVAAGKRAVTVKVVPYALGRQQLDDVRRARGAGPVFSLRPYTVRSAVLVTVGPEGSHAGLEEAFGASLGDRLAALGIPLTLGPRAAEDVEAMRAALDAARAGGPGMLLVAGHDSVVDADDRLPRALRAAGAEVVRHGLPTEPGSLLLLARWGDTPVVGAAGCARSHRLNGIDLVLPRLAAGERLTAADLAALGHGGLLS